MAKMTAEDIVGLVGQFETILHKCYNTSMDREKNLEPIVEEKYKREMQTEV